MNNNQKEMEPHWIQELKSSPFKKPPFTKEMMTTVLERSTNNRKPSGKKYKRLSRVVAAGACTIAILGMIWIISPSLIKNNNSTPMVKPAAPTVDWTPHSQYNTAEGVTKLHVFPGGDYPAGSPSGSWWNLYVPVETLEGQNIRITATHKETGMQIEELPPTKITPEMAYDNFTRVSSTFSLPLSGFWKFDMYIGEEKFGDVVFDVPDSSWEPSPVFTSGNFEMTGVENRLGFIHPGFQAGQSNKYMWHFWGRDEELNGELKITAVKQNSFEIIDVFESKLSPGKLNGADAALPSSMSLPTSGLWRLMASIDGQLYGSVIVEVK